VPSFTGQQLQKATGQIRAEARRAPVEITYHGRPELVVMSVEDYELLRTNRKLVLRREDLPAAELERISANRMDEAHRALDALMDD